ncbi:glycosyltransferase family 2 protein [Funiculus sociatus GB2-A5]|jgi:GT2 family glycosyltransferase|uniref:Glycosyltransferase family 2 protein n=1 Tax=Funiculus sociatus GB2-A5 TaxID=2933946 RepID=A0ABV0JS67_9CYAN|nr:MULTISPECIES: glycosyltransferase family 2 protein [unclassified Trichocoleus]MBD1908906.1 glycosyltransferase family 2 protein [Trichocoleus sp. FACHB-832]MBD2064555.1 glycosyltransferase family 2 protein [Trichocoleus sp. FACHB-6]
MGTSIAILITCYNRKPKTLASLEALFNQVLPADFELCVYLVDDGSTDGTTEAVSHTYPQVKIIEGNGNLFWNGGMRMAFSEAIKHNHNYHLWLNDDTLIYPDALSKMLATSQRLAEQGYAPVIVTGATRDPETNTVSYGGVERNTWWHPFKFRWLEPGEEPTRCDTMHGNCVLIPREIYQTIGNLDPDFRHYAGDFDYGLRAKQKGYTVWLAPGYIGTCSGNPLYANWMDSNLPIRERWQKAEQPKNFTFKERQLFAQRHAGILWPIFWLLPYRKLLFSSFGKRRQEGT